MQVVLRDESFGKIPILELNDKLIRLGFKVRESMLVKTSSQTDLAFKNRQRPTFHKQIRKSKNQSEYFVFIGNCKWARYFVK